MSKMAVCGALVSLLIPGCGQQAPSGVPISELIGAVRKAIIEVDANRPGALPVLSSITLTVETFAKTEGGGKVKLYVMTADGEVSDERTQVIKFVLQPPALKAQIEKRGVIQPPPLDQLLSQTIINAAREAQGALTGQPKLALTEFTVTVKFVVAKEGSVGLTLEPIEASGGGATVSATQSNTDTIEVTFKPPEMSEKENSPASGELGPKGETLPLPRNTMQAPKQARSVFGGTAESVS